MRAAFLRGVEALGAIAMPAAVGFALVARDLTPLLLGEKWLAAVPVIEIITPVMGVQMPLLATQYYAMALGLTKLVFIRELIFFLIRTPVFIWASVEYGLTGAAWAVAACGVIHIVLNLALYARASGDGALTPMWRARRTILAAASMVGALLWLRGAGLTGDASTIVRLVVEIVAGVGAYAGAHAVLWRLEGAPEGVERSILHFGAQALSRIRR
jgi:PST family polysaccharide transporter